MNNEHDESKDLRFTVREGRSLAALTLVLALVFGAYFSLRVAMPDLPLRVHQALASLPSQGQGESKGSR